MTFSVPEVRESVRFAIARLPRAIVMGKIGAKSNLARSWLEAVSATLTLKTKFAL